MSNAAAGASVCAHPTDGSPASAEYDGLVDTPEVKRAVRRLDWVLIPLLHAGYALAFSDKVILSSASVMGLRKDTHLDTSQYSWVSSVFYFGYLSVICTGEVIPHVPSVLPLSVLTCAVVVGCHAACQTYAGLIACRILLGLAESVLSPSFLFITSSFYTRDEVPGRVGAWFAGNSIGGMTSSLYAYGVGHIKYPLTPWRWLFIILSICQLLYGLGITVLLPMKITQARWLTGRQKYLLARRLEARGSGSPGKKELDPRQVRCCFMDPKTWIAVLLATACQLPNAALQSFSNIVLKSFDFTSLQTTLLNIPYSVIAAASIAGLGYLTGRSSQLNCYCIVLCSCICIVGSSLIYVRPRTSRGVQLFGYFLLSVGPANFSLLLGLCQANNRGVTKTATFNVLVFVFYSAANIAGPHLFIGSQAPRYQGAFCAIMVCYATTAALAIVMRCHLTHANAQRDRLAASTLANCLPARGSLPMPTPVGNEQAKPRSSVDGKPAGSALEPEPEPEPEFDPEASLPALLQIAESDGVLRTDRTDVEDPKFRYRL